MKYDKIILFADCDGTLIGRRDTGAAEIHYPENQEAINYFIENGGRFSYASGRSEADTLRLPYAVNAPLILSNGSEVYDPVSGQWVYQLYLPNSAIELISEIYELFPQLSLVARNAKEFFVFNEEKSLFDFRIFPWFDGIFPIERLGELRDRVVSIAISGAYPEALEQVCVLMERKYPEMVCSVVATNFLNVVPKGISKGSALAYIRDMYYSGEEGLIFAAVGDNENDLEMLQEADYAFAMGNATENVKAAAVKVLKDNSHPCIPQILDYLDSVVCSKQSQEEKTSV